jgi:hypothetical protein
MREVFTVMSNLVTGTDTWFDIWESLSRIEARTKGEFVVATVHD